MPLQDPSQAKLSAQANLVYMVINNDLAAACVRDHRCGSLTSLLQLQHSLRGFPQIQLLILPVQSPRSSPNPVPNSSVYSQHLSFQEHTHI